MTDIRKSDARPLNPVSRICYQLALILGASAVAGFAYHNLPTGPDLGVIVGVCMGAGYGFRWLEDWRR